MIRCLAIDDEPLALELLEDNISKVPYLQLVAACENAMEAMKIMQQQPIDLIFLDIQMPGLTGLQFIQSMTVKPMIILITAYEKYALQGFDLDVTDYLVKPVSLDRFVKACNKAKELYGLKTQPKTTVDAGYFFVNVEYSLIKIITADIVYIEGLKDYISIFTKAERVITLQNMKKMEETLPRSQFIRVHKSYIIALDKIESIERSRITICGKIIPIGDTYRDEFFKKIENNNI